MFINNPLFSGIGAPVAKDEVSVQTPSTPSAVNPLFGGIVGPAYAANAVSTPAPTPAPTVANPAEIEALYQKYAGRSADPTGAQFWAERFGPSITPDEIAEFQRSVADNVAKGIETNAASLVANYDPYFAANPDVAASYLKDTKGLSPEEFARQHYENYGLLEGRAVPNWITDTKDPIEELYNTYAGRWSDPTGYQHWSTKFGSTVDENERKIFQEAVESARNVGIEAPETYTKITKNSTPEQIAAAYDQFVNSSGNADDLRTKQNAIQYLNKIGVDPKTIADTYKQYKEDYASGDAKQIFGTFGSVVSDGADANKQLEGILSGFEALGRGDFTEEQAKRLLGEDKFNTYKTTFGSTLKTGIGDILADKKLSGEEALSAVQTARKYGLDNEKLSAITGYDKKLFDTISEGYDTTVNSLVDKAFEGKADIGDRTKTGLALQSQYGLSDEDLAKAADLSVDEVKGWLDPVRTFGAEYKTILTKPDASGKEIIGFLDKAKANPAITSIYGDNISALEGKINELNQKWKGRDGYQAENIYNQINQITNAVGGKNWTGSWSGSGGDSAMKAAVGVLMDRGVDNLSDLAVAPAYKKMAAPIEFYNGNRVFTSEDGRKYTLAENPSRDGFEPITVPNNAKLVPGVSFGYGEEGEEFRPLTAEELKTYDPKTKQFDAESGKRLIDKSTGRTIAEQKRGFLGRPTSEDNKFVLHSYDTGDWFKSESKEFGIIMTDQGVPVPYQTSQKDGLLYSPVLPIAASFLLPGIGTTISGGLASAGGSALAAGTLANTALTQGILSGGMAALTGGDVGKSFLGGAIGAPISQGISSLLPTGMDPNMAKFATNVGTNLARGAIMGTPANLQGSLINAGVQYGAGQLPWNLSPQQVNLLAGIATPLLQGQSIDPIRLGGILTNYAIKSQQPQKGA